MTEPQQLKLDPIKFADALAGQRNAALNAAAQAEAVVHAQAQHIAALEALRDELQAENAGLLAKLAEHETRAPLAAVQ